MVVTLQANTIQQLQLNQKIELNQNKLNFGVLHVSPHITILVFSPDLRSYHSIVHEEREVNSVGGSQASVSKATTIKSTLSFPLSSQKQQQQKRSLVTFYNISLVTRCLFPLVLHVSPHNTILVFSSSISKTITTSQGRSSEESLFPLAMHCSAFRRENLNENEKIRCVKSGH